METLEINKFANLHDGKKIFFAALDHCEFVFEEIRKIEGDVILITGNSDSCVGTLSEIDKNEEYLYRQIKRINGIFNDVPKNVKYWFAQNNITGKKNIIPIPIGLCNGTPHFRSMHGLSSTISLDYNERLKNIYLNNNSSPKNFLYLNYNLHPSFRQQVTDKCKKHLDSYITVDRKELMYDTYLQQILDHECMMCPVGVGVDCYRIYETLYCKRIPITINVSHLKDINYKTNFVFPNISYQENDYPLYTELYSKLPIVILNSIEELEDIDHLKKLVEEQKNKQWDRNLLDFNYWKQIILNLSESI